MKFVCDSCERLVEPASFRIQGEALLLACPRCQAESKLERTAQESPPSRPVVVPFASRPAPVEPPQSESEDEAPVMVVPASERCPKCAEPKNGRSACAKCGLIFELYRPEEDAIPSSARRDFAQMLETGDLKLLDVVPTERLAHLARLCRHHLADFPGEPRASAILERLTARSLALASATSHADSLASPGGKGRNLVFILAFLGILTAAALFFAALHSP